VDLEVIDRLRVYSEFFRCWRNKWEYSATVRHLCTDFKTASGSFRREILYNTLLEFSINVKHVGLIKMCLHETHSNTHIRKHFPLAFPIRNGVKQRYDLSPMLFDFALGYAVSKVHGNETLELNGTY
jgi:hypothetical protein